MIYKFVMFKQNMFYDNLKSFPPNSCLPRKDCGLAALMVLEKTGTGNFTQHPWQTDKLILSQDNTKYI